VHFKTSPCHINASMPIFKGSEKLQQTPLKVVIFFKLVRVNTIFQNYKLVYYRKSVTMALTGIMIRIEPELLVIRNYG